MAAEPVGPGIGLAGEDSITAEPAGMWASSDLPERGFGASASSDDCGAMIRSNQSVSSIASMVAAGPVSGMDTPEPGMEAMRPRRPNSAPLFSYSPSTEAVTPDSTFWNTRSTYRMLRKNVHACDAAGLAGESVVAGCWTAATASTTFLAGAPQLQEEDVDMLASCESSPVKNLVSAAVAPVMEDAAALAAGELASAAGQASSSAARAAEVSLLEDELNLDVDLPQPLPALDTRPGSSLDGCVSQPASVLDTRSDSWLDSQSSHPASSMPAEVITACCAVTACCEDTLSGALVPEKDAVVSEKAPMVVADVCPDSCKEMDLASSQLETVAAAVAPDIETAGQPSACACGTVADATAIEDARASREAGVTEAFTMTEVMTDAKESVKASDPQVSETSPGVLATEVGLDDAVLDPALAITSAIGMDPHAFVKSRQIDRLTMAEVTLATDSTFGSGPLLEDVAALAAGEWARTHSELSPVVGAPDTLLSSSCNVIEDADPVVAGVPVSVIERTSAPPEPTAALVQNDYDSCIQAGVAEASVEAEVTEGDTGNCQDLVVEDTAPMTIEALASACDPLVLERDMSNSPASFVDFSVSSVGCFASAPRLVSGYLDTRKLQENREACEGLQESALDAAALHVATAFESVKLQEDAEVSIVESTVPMEVKDVPTHRPFIQAGSVQTFLFGGVIDDIPIGSVDIALGREGHPDIPELTAMHASNGDVAADCACPQLFTAEAFLQDQEASGGASAGFGCIDTADEQVVAPAENHVGIVLCADQAMLPDTPDVMESQDSATQTVSSSSSTSPLPQEPLDNRDQPATLDLTSAVCAGQGVNHVEMVMAEGQARALYSGAPDVAGVAQSCHILTARPLTVHELIGPSLAELLSGHEQLVSDKLTKPPFMGDENHFEKVIAEHSARMLSLDMPDVSNAAMANTKGPVPSAELTQSGGTSIALPPSLCDSMRPPCLDAQSLKASANDQAGPPCLDVDKLKMLYSSAASSAGRPPSIRALDMLPAAVRHAVVQSNVPTMMAPEPNVLSEIMGKDVTAEVDCGPQMDLSSSCGESAEVVPLPTLPIRPPAPNVTALPLHRRNLVTSNVTRLRSGPSEPAPLPLQARPPPPALTASPRDLCSLRTEPAETSAPQRLPPLTPRPPPPTISAPPVHFRSAVSIDLASLRGEPAEAASSSYLTGPADAVTQEMSTDSFDHLSEMLNMSSLFRGRGRTNLSEQVAAAASGWMGKSGERQRAAGLLGGWMREGKQLRPLRPIGSKEDLPS